MLYLISGVLMFGFGALHDFAANLRKVARTYRLAGIKIAMASLYLLTFEIFSGYEANYFFRPNAVSDQLVIGFTIFCVLAVLAGAAALFFNPSKSETNTLESFIGLGLVAVAAFSFYFPSANAVYTVLFNLLLAGIILTLIVAGYRREDMHLVDTGIFWAMILLVTRYFDFFWELLPRSIFLMVGGIVLLMGSIALERKRKELKAKFHHPASV
jgi:uncharacterized membrane protein